MSKSKALSNTTLRRANFLGFVARRGRSPQLQGATSMAHPIEIVSAFGSMRS